MTPDERVAPSEAAIEAACHQWLEYRLLGKPILVRPVVENILRAAYAVDLAPLVARIAELEAEVVTQYEEMTEAITHLSADRDRLRKALRPFAFPQLQALLLEEFEELGTKVKTADVRRARAALGEGTA